MAELLIKVPDELEYEFRGVGEVEANEIVCKALREHLSERLMFKFADELLRNSEMTDNRALELGNELKERVAKRHGL